MFRQLSVVVVFSLGMSLFVAVTLVPVLCSKLLVLPKPAAERTGLAGRLYTFSENALDQMDERYSRLIHKALAHRPTVLAGAAASVLLAAVIFPTLPTELSTEADEGQVSVTVELPQGTRIEVMEPILLRVEGAVRELVPEATAIVVSAGAGAGGPAGGAGGGGGGAPGGGGGAARGQVQILLTSKDERDRSSTQIANDLRAQLSGIPGVVIRAMASGGNRSLNRFLGGGNAAAGRLALEIRGEDLASSDELARSLKELLDDTPEVTGAQLGRDEGRPELAVRIDRDKAALLGVSATAVANTLRTNLSGTQAALYRTGGKEYPIIVRLREDQRQDVVDVEGVLISTPQGAVLPVKNLMTIDNAVGPTQIQRKNQERINYVNAEPLGAMSDAVDAVERRLPELLDITPDGFSVGFGAAVEEPARVQPAPHDADPRADPGLRGDGVPVRVAA
jgi:HAE1 family hydrophobic/amphiphilic exporter-1